MSQKAIYVTQPHLPALDEFVPYLEEIWSSGFVTNNGRMHQALERELAVFLGVEHVVLFNNATTALLAALRALGRQGEVITTPFSFVATAHSILWQGMTPVFADISRNSLNLDPSRIEAAINARTVAIMPVHCYGHACDTQAIQEIAERHGIPVIYDAAHAFGVTDDGGSILRHGDMSVVSFHATKVFNTFEGGAIITQDPTTRQCLERIRNFGFVNEMEVPDCGINGKMSEVNAAFGLLQLRHAARVQARRRAVHEAYVRGLEGVTGLHIHAPLDLDRHNFSYFPILVGPEFPINRDALHDALKARNIYARRYFYPLISNFSHYAALPSTKRENLPVANQMSDRILCLPIHTGMSPADVERITEAITGIATLANAA